MVLVDQCVPVLCREEGGVSEKEDPVLEPGEEKQRIEDLWNSFKQEAHHGQSDRSCKARCWFVGMLLTKQGAEPRKDEGNKTVAIQKTYDFAGEEVIVVEKVAADSKEAKKFLGEPLGSEAVATSTATKPAATVGAKRKGGVGSVLEMLNKKPKMSTLEKSKLDWMKYRQQEGLEEQLEQNKKDGYLERQDFLKRSEMKQYELERELKMKRFAK
ncbi:hypothetical protein EMCRGX_G031183 [Ephydatia muelleri]|eukprot:Em0018g835a